MRRPPTARFPAIAFAVTVMLAGCGMGVITGDPARPAMPAGSREWIIEVDNQSAQPALLMVAEDTMPVGQLVGVADPPQVPPKTKQDVVFSVPPGQTWAIFVNPGPERGPLILAMDVPPDAEGRLPVAIVISPNGEPGAMSGDNPGWFGN
jgi:hypothetical protein